LTQPLKFRDSAATHVGNVRRDNEDSHLSSPAAGIWLVADGMGGHTNGRYASETIAEALSAIAAPDMIEQACDAVAETVHAANARIFEKSRQLGSLMGSTFVALVVRGRDFAVLWAGDSRAYLFRDRKLILLTRDHTPVQDMLEQGLLSSDEARDHPMRHVLSRAVGVQETMQIDAIRDMIEPRDIFLLCTDGLHGVLPDAEIAKILSEKGHDASEDLVSSCLELGAPDNVTVTVVEAREPTLLVSNGPSE
jgi:serine/threonine protein phosphatase PrpC